MSTLAAATATRTMAAEAVGAVQQTAQADLTFARLATTRTQGWLWQAVREGRGVVGLVGVLVGAQLALLAPAVPPQMQRVAVGVPTTAAEDRPITANVGTADFIGAEAAADTAVVEGAGTVAGLAGMVVAAVRATLLLLALSS